MIDQERAKEILRIAMIPLLRARGWELSSLSVERVRSESTPGGHAIRASFSVVHSESHFVAGDYGEPDEEIESRLRSSAAAVCEQVPHLKDPRQFAFSFGWLPLIRENMALKMYVPTGVQLDILRKGT